jgi:hypothetical protein
MAKATKATKAKNATKAKDAKLATLAQCATALNLGARRVQQLAAEGLPKSARGRYDVGKCLRWYVRYLQKKLKDAALPDPDGGHTASIAMRHKLLSIESELKQIELAKERRQLVTIDKVTKDLASMVLEIKQRILQIPPRLAAEVIGEKDLVTITDKIDRSLKDALVQLSKYDPDLAPRAGAVVRAPR